MIDALHKYYIMKTLEQYLLESKTTLQYHSVLNPKFWDGESLKNEVRKKLVEVGRFWAKYANIPANAIKDIILTGGNANFNYTDFSDLDVHIFVDKSKIADCEVEIMDDYLKDKKQLWALTHDIKIYGVPVELYAQDLKEKTSPNQGVFSLLKNKWVKKPVKEKVNFDDPMIVRKAKALMRKIDSIIEDRVDNMQIIKDFKDKMKNMRSSGVQKGGEFSIENLVFKELRNKGYLDKLVNYAIKVEDKAFSLKEKGKK